MVIKIKDKFPNLEKLDIVMEEFKISNLNEAKVHSVLSLVSQKVNGKSESILSRFNTTNTQILIILLLYFSDEKETPINISKKLGLSTASISNVLNTLYKKGFIRKEKHKNDKRSYHVFLTDNSINFLNKFLPEYYAKSKQLFVNFSQEEIEIFKILLLKLFSNLDFFD